MNADTSAYWAIRLDRRDSASAGRLRQLAGVEVCEEGDKVWLRGRHNDEKLGRRLAAVPGAERFAVLGDGQLLPAGRRLPLGRLPSAIWTPIARWIALSLRPGQFAGRTGQTAALRLVRSDVEKEAAILLTTAEIWRAYAVEAPQVRLERWRFALAADGRVAVHGRPLPPLPGSRWVEEQGIAVPAGWTWSPAVAATIIREVFGLAAGDIALWHEDGSWEHIRADDFVKASRSAVRKSVSCTEY